MSSRKVGETQLQRSLQIPFSQGRGRGAGQIGINLGNQPKPGSESVRRTVENREEDGLDRRCKGRGRGRGGKGKGLECYSSATNKGRGRGKHKLILN